MSGQDVPVLLMFVLYSGAIFTCGVVIGGKIVFRCLVKRSTFNEGRKARS
jgi:hypothetical protein